MGRFLGPDMWRTNPETYGYDIRTPILAIVIFVVSAVGFFFLHKYHPQPFFVDEERLLQMRMCSPSFPSAKDLQRSSFAHGSEGGLGRSSGRLTDFIMQIPFDPYKTSAPGAGRPPISDTISHVETVSDTPVMKVERIHLTAKGKKMLTANIDGPLPGPSDNIRSILEYGLDLQKRNLEKTRQGIPPLEKTQRPTSPGRAALIYVACGAGIMLGIISLNDAIGKIIAAQ